MRCDICRGSQTIRLPIYKRVSAVLSVGLDDARFEPSYREYPCPECTPVIPKEKVRVVECFVESDIRHEREKGYREHLINHAVLDLAHEIEKHGFARIQEMPETRTHNDALTFKRRRYRISIGVIAARDTAAFDAERYAAEDSFAGLVMEIAAKQIDNWGSYYGNSNILKRDAKRLLAEAARTAKDMRPTTEVQP